MDLSDSDMGPKKIVTWDMSISFIGQGIWGITTETCDIDFSSNRNATPAPMTVVKDPYNGRVYTDE